MLIYKIFRAAEWHDLEQKKTTVGAPIDISDGFIHFSTADQVKETAALHFAGVDGLWLLAVDADVLGGDLKWEPSRGGKLFPHLFRELSVTDVIWAKPLPLENEIHVFPNLDERV